MHQKNDHIRNMIFGLDTPVKLSCGKCVPAINLDNAATTPPFKDVISEITSKLKCYGSIGRGEGRKSEYSTDIYIKGREIVKDFVGAGGLYTAFYVNSTTDGMNKLASALINSPDDMVLLTRMEHHANDLPWRERAHTVHAEVDGQGRLIMSDMERLLAEHQSRIKYVSVTAASNVTGYVNDVHQIARLAHRYGARLIVDGAQIVAHRPFSMQGPTPEENVDFFVFSAHKMYSPFGGGAVVGPVDVLSGHQPAFYGGGMVEAVCDETVRYLAAPDRYEAGSPNYPGVVGMLKAIGILKSIGFDYIQAHERALLQRALEGLKRIPGVILYGDCEHIGDRVGIIVFGLRGMKPEAVARQLADHRAISVRHAAFCAHPYVRRLTREPGGDQDAQAYHAPEGMVRISFGIYSSQADVDAFLAAVRELPCRGRLKERAGGPGAAASLIVKPYDRA